MLERQELSDQFATLQETLDAIFRVTVLVQLSSTRASDISWTNEIQTLATSGNATAKRFLEFASVQRSQVAKRVSKTGTDARRAKFTKLQVETIRLYEEGNGKWKSAASAARDIAPKIVAMSAKGNGDLVADTPLPVRWIRNHISRHRGQ